MLKGASISIIWKETSWEWQSFFIALSIRKYKD
jgi:hypothetical protein